jgi:hypothetical protein
MCTFDEVVPLKPLEEIKLFLVELPELKRALHNVGQHPEPSTLVHKSAKKPTLWQRFFSRNSCAPSGGFIRVRVQELNQFVYIFPSVHDRVDDALARHNIVEQHQVCYSHKNKTLKLSTTFAQNNIHDGDVIIANPYPMKGGSSRFLVSGALCRLAFAIFTLLIWLSLQLIEKRPRMFELIQQDRKKMRKNTSIWLNKMSKKIKPTRSFARKSRYCPQNVAVSLLEKEVTGAKCFKNLSNSEWDQVYHKAVDKFAFERLEVQSFELSGIEELLETSLAMCERANIDDYVKLSEDVLVMLKMLSSSETRMDMLGAVAVFAKLRTKGSLTLGAFRSALLLALDWFFNPTDAQAYELEDIRSIMDNYKDLKHSALAEKLHCFMLFALGYSLFDSIGMKIEPLKLKSMSEAARDKTAWKSADFTYLCLETILFVCERGVQCYQIGSLQPMFHSSKTHEKWITECEKIKIWATCLGNPTPHGFTVFQYQNELDELIEKGDSIAKVMAAEGPREKYAAMKLLCELKMLKASFITSNDASRDRIEPFGTLIAGGSSVMKSTFSKILFYHYAKVMGLPASSDYRYVRNCLDEYWSGFKTSKWCIHLDDIAPFKPAAVMGVDPSVAEALQVLNTVAYVTNQAELNDKGKIPIRARLVTSTTNVIDMNAFAYYENDLAPRRRFPVVLKLEMKEDYATNGMCDASKIPSMTNAYLDVWRISMYKVCAAEGQNTGELVPKQRARLELVEVYESIDDFLEVFSRLAKRQFEVQQKATIDDGVMAKIEICSTCCRRRCNCFDTQASEQYAPVPSSVEEESEYAESEADEEDSVYHHCEYDREVELCERLRDGSGWRVALVKPSATSLCSGSYKFDAAQIDLHRGPNFSLMWCGAREARLREEAAFNPDVLRVDVNAARDITADYFDVVRAEHNPLQLTWWISFSLSGLYTFSWISSSVDGWLRRYWLVV